MFKESRYQHQLKRLNDQDKRLSFESSTVEDWYEPNGFFHLILSANLLLKVLSINYNFRFELVPEAGRHKGLTLVLDAHQDLVSASSVSENFLVKNYEHMM